MVVKIVTDSASDLPPELARSLDITVVPLRVRFGNEEFRDGADLSIDEFYQRLIAGPELPKTSQPSVGDFVNVYNELGGDADGIVSIHISSKVSGTVNSADQARAEADTGCPIEVIDTLQASMGVGMVAIAAAKAVQKGAGLEDATAVAKDAATRCECFVLLDTLEYLEKGGRIGKARALLGTILRIKPMIIVRDGEVHELGKERTRSRGVAKLQSVAGDFAPVDELCVLHNTTPAEADSVAENLGGLLPEGQEPLITRFGAVIGTYTGPGALGVGLLRSEALST